MPFKMSGPQTSATARQARAIVETEQDLDSSCRSRNSNEMNALLPIRCGAEQDVDMKVDGELLAAPLAMTARRA